MREVYKSRTYARENVCKMYMNCQIDGEFKVFGVDGKGFTIWEAFLDDERSRSDFHMLANFHRGKSFSAVELPMNATDNPLVEILP